MKKGFIISVEIDNELENVLNNIRWKHIDIDTLIKEELEEYVKDVIRFYEEVVQ